MNPFPNRSSDSAGSPPQRRPPADRQVDLELLYKPGQQSENFDASLACVTELSDHDLVQLARVTPQTEARAFIVRGACFSVLSKRAPPQLNGGRGKRDETGIGVQAYLKTIAEQIGCDLTTVRTDARIYEAFYQPVVAPETRLALERSMPCLPREYYVVALSAADPQAALEVALVGKDAGRYTCREFRSHVRSLTPARAAHANPANDSILLRVRVSRAARDVLTALRDGRGDDEIVTEAILALGRERNSRSETAGTKSLARSLPSPSAGTNGSRADTAAGSIGLPFTIAHPDSTEDQVF